MIDSKTCAGLLAFFERLLAFYREFLELEKRKYEILKQSRLEELDQLLKDEQAFTLKARGYEAERQAMMEETSAPKAKFRELIPLFEPELQNEAERFYREISATMNELKLTNDRCGRLTKLKLRRVATLKAQAGRRPEPRSTYGKSHGKNGADGEKSGILSKKI